MDNKTWFDLTDEERNERKKLTPQEQELVNAFINAARALPKTICIGMDDFDGELTVSKRVTAGSAMQVAKLKKQSLFF